RQVKALEAQLGVQLFAGPKHRLELTAAGRELAPVLTRASAEISAAVGRVRTDGDDLRVAVNASISVKWLIPRLPDFTARFPQVRLHLEELAPDASSHRRAQAVGRLHPSGRLADPLATPFIRNHTGPVLAPS